jgi:ribonucleoside-diphosphate reductase beta chain
MTELNKRKLYDVTAPNKSTKIVNGESSNVLNWDDVRFQWSYPMYKSMLANFWIPSEINMSNDIKQWNELSEDEQDTFLKIIGLLAFLDSIQTDFSTQVSEFLTDSSLNALMAILAFQEVVHNQSYSYVLSSLVPKHKQEQVFEFWKHDPVIRERNDFIAEGYEEFTNNKTPETFMKAIVYDVLLEGLFFYAGFAFFYNLARNGKMSGTSQMINYINKDELIHVNLFVQTFQALLEDYPELNTPENMKWVTETIKRGAELEIKWSEHIIGNKFDGININDVSEYVKFRANQRASQLGVEKPFDRIEKNPIPWIKYYEDVNESKADFFETKPRSYAKISDDNGFDDL